MTEFDQADKDANGSIDRTEWDAMRYEFERERLKDENAKRDVQRRLAEWSAVAAFTYPLWLVACDLASLDKAINLIGDIAGTFYISAMGIIMAFYGKEAIEAKGVKK